MGLNTLGISLKGKCLALNPKKDMRKMMNFLFNKIASIVYPCNWGGDFHRCFQFRDSHCSDYTRQKHMQHIADIMEASKTKDYCTIAQAIFPCNVGGAFSVCDKIHCPVDLVRLHKKQTLQVISEIYHSALV